MGPRLVERGKALFVPSSTNTKRASMGPRLVERGKAVKQLNDLKADELQWGRAWLSAERWATGPAPRPRPIASMGPRLVERGKSSTPSR